VLHVANPALLCSNALQLLQHVPRHAALGLTTAQQELSYCCVTGLDTRQQAVQVLLQQRVDSSTAVMDCCPAEAGPTCTAAQLGDHRLNQALNGGQVLGQDLWVVLNGVGWWWWVEGRWDDQQSLNCLRLAQWFYFCSAAAAASLCPLKPYHAPRPHKTLPLPSSPPPHLHDAGLFLQQLFRLSQLLPQCIQVHTGGLQEQALNITTQQLEHAFKLNNLQTCQEGGRRGGGGGGAKKRE